MNITVILCTHNRCQMLRKTLESLAASTVPAATQWQVLVVDNNSTDQTREVVAEFSLRHSERFLYLFEPKPGKSYALNSGIREARGQILAFLDDDVTVEPTWLQNLTSNLKEPEWAGSGGRTLAANSFSPPRWLALSGPYSMVGILYAHFDRGEVAGKLDSAPYGANMAFRKEMFEKYGDFRVDLGPSPDPEIPRPSEDTEFGRRLMAAGHQLRYEPSAVAYHPVLQDRINKKYFLDWWFDYGRALVRERGGSDADSAPKIIGRVVPMALRWLATFDPQLRFYRKCWLWVAAGEAAELRRQSHRIKTHRAEIVQAPGIGRNATR